jgi:hypothetical protein
MYVASALVNADVFVSGGPVFVDCNSVAPDRDLRIETAIRVAGGAVLMQVSRFFAELDNPRAN